MAPAATTHTRAPPSLPFMVCPMRGLLVALSLAVAVLSACVTALTGWRADRESEEGHASPRPQEKEKVCAEERGGGGGGG